MRLRLMTGQCKRRNEVEMDPRIAAGTDRDRPARPFDRLIVLLQREMAPRFPIVTTVQSWIVRAEANRLVKKFETLFNLPTVQVVPAQADDGAHAGRVQSERPFVLRDRFVEAPLTKEYKSLRAVGPCVIRVEGERSATPTRRPA